MYPRPSVREMSIMVRDLTKFLVFPSVVSARDFQKKLLISLCVNTTIHFCIDKTISSSMKDVWCFRSLDRTLIRDSRLTKSFDFALDYPFGTPQISPNFRLRLLLEVASY